MDTDYMNGMSQNLSQIACSAVLPVESTSSLRTSMLLMGTRYCNRARKSMSTVAMMQKIRPATGPTARYLCSVESDERTSFCYHSMTYFSNRLTNEGKERACAEWYTRSTRAAVSAHEYMFLRDS